jgi:hypothetical protein
MSPVMNGLTLPRHVGRASIHQGTHVVGSALRHAREVHQRSLLMVIGNERIRRPVAW